jgi:hypothetical protein
MSSRSADDTPIPKKSFFHENVSFLLFLEGSGAASTKKSKGDSGPAIVPVIEDAPKDISILKGKNAVLKAVFNSESMPEIKWMKNGEKMASGSRIKIDNIRDKTTLTIRECEQSDIAKYTVKLENEEGVVTASASVNVEGEYSHVILY